MFAASSGALFHYVDTEPGIAEFLLAVRTATLHCLRMDLMKGPILSNSKALTDYLSASMAYAPSEELRVLFLNSQNRLLRDEVMAHGSIMEVSIYPREIVKRALELGATALILVHNHPSGDPHPTQSDVQATARIIEGARALEVVVHDHIVIAKSGWTSFRALGLL